jgi:hypothetical protein
MRNLSVQILRYKITRDFCHTQQAERKEQSRFCYECPSHQKHRRTRHYNEEGTNKILTQIQVRIAQIHHTYVIHSQKINKIQLFSGAFLRGFPTQ